MTTPEPPKVSPILDLAWKRAANFSAHSGRRKNGFYNARRWIAILGVLATFIAILTQVNQAWLQEPRNAGIALLARIIFVATPVLASMLAAFASKKYANGDWWITRAAAEEIRKEIYFYSTIWPKEKIDGKDSRDEMLEKSLAQTQRQVFQAMGGVFALEEPATPRNIGFGDLTGDEYFHQRLEDQLNWHNGKINQLKQSRDRMTVLILATGALGTVLATLGTSSIETTTPGAVATLNWGIWVALTASITSALIGWEQLRGNEAVIRNYSKVVLELSILRDHWLRLSPQEKANPAELEGMVRGCEKVLWEQNTEYIRAMQDLLKGNNLDEESKLVNEGIDKLVATNQATIKTMQEATIQVVNDAADSGGEMVSDSYQATLDSLKEDGSELLQKQLDSASQAVAQAADNLVARMPTLSSVVGQIAQDYSHVDVGRDTSKEQLNEILARYPKTGELKG
ncbi:MAG: SLATT domain-containing protein [Bacteroidota bacterium]